MIKAMLVSANKDSFSDIKSVFAENNVETMWAESGSKALSIVFKTSLDIIVIDESVADMTGLDLAKKLISKNPMLNIAIISTLSAEDFHESSAGLGILMQLSPAPSKSESEKLLANLNNILSLTRTS